MNLTQNRKRKKKKKLRKDTHVITVRWIQKEGKKKLQLGELVVGGW